MELVRALPIVTWAATPPTPTAPTGAPPEKEPKEIYSPSAGSLAAIYLSPPAAAAAGFAIGTAAGVGAMVVGASIGCVGGAVVGFIGGGIADLANFMGKDHKYRYKAASLGAVVGTVGGAVLAHLLPPVAGGIGLGVVGLGIGYTVSTLTRHGVDSTQKRAVENALASGQVSVMPFLRKLAEAKGKSSPQAPALLEAFRSLESSGWRFGDPRTAFEYALSSSSYGYDVHVTTAAGTRGEVPADVMPALAYLVGKGTLADATEKALVDRIADSLAKGRVIGTGWERPQAAGNAEERAMQAANAYGAIKHGQRLNCVQDGLDFKIDAKSLADLDAGLKSMDDTCAAYGAIFGQALAAGELDRDQRQAIMEASVSSPLGASLDKAGPLLLSLNGCWVKAGESAQERTKRTLSVFRQLGEGQPGAVDFEQAVNLVVKLQARLTPEDSVQAVKHLRQSQPQLDPAEAERYQKDFMRLLFATGDTATAVSAAHIAHTVSTGVAEPLIALMEGLATATAPQPGYHEIVVDFATLMAARDPAEPVEQSAAQYCELLRGLSSAQQAREAAPTYAFLRSVQPDRMADGIRSVLARVSAGEAPSAVRESMGAGARSDIPRDELNQLLGPQEGARAADLMQALPADKAAEHLDIVRQMAAATPGETAEQRKLILNYATLMSARDPQVPLADSASSYCLLLRGLHDMAASQEAAPTFLFLRDNQARGKFGDRKLDDLANQFLTTMFTARDGDRARSSMLAQIAMGTPDGGVKKGDGEVKIGGVSIPIRRTEP